MRISIVIPSLNQCGFLKENLDSLIAANDPDLEILVADGGSSDGSRELLQAYGRHLAWWCSEADGGQSEAINKALAHSTGAIWCYLNSDDLLLPQSFGIVRRTFSQHPECLWAGGVCEVFDEKNILGLIRPVLPQSRKEFLSPWNRAVQYAFPCSNVSFMRQEVLARLGPFDSSLHYGMDIEYYARAVFRGGFLPRLIPEILGRWRFHPNSKTMQAGMAWGFRQDEITVAERYAAFLSPEEQALLDAELAQQRRALPCRRALHELDNGQRKAALRTLLGSLAQYPDNLWHRPWLGALRRILMKTPTQASSPP